jgi:hypothetical protein
MMDAAVWIASEGYIDDATCSATSLREIMPDMDRILVTDGNQLPEIFTHGLKMPDRQFEHWYHDSCLWYNLALEQFDMYERLVFFDTDTYIAYSFQDMLEVLDRYDILAVHGAARHTAPTVEALPDAFPELEIGVMAVRNNERVKKLFAQWLALYDDHPEVYGENDQGPLREALWNNQEVKLYVLPAEYHCRWPFGAQVCGYIRVLHSRAGDQPAMAEIFNETGRMRLVCTDGVVFLR